VKKSSQVETQHNEPCSVSSIRYSSVHNRDSCTGVSISHR